MCKDCGKSYKQYSGLQTLCGHCQYNKQVKPRKPLKRFGKVTRQWWETRNQWLQANPPVSGRWYCNYCDKPLNIDELTLDHKNSRGRRPDQRNDLDNLVPCCAWDNAQKGSLNEEEYKLKLRSTK